MQDVSLWRLPRVCEATGFRRSSIYRMIRLGRFPAPVRIGERARAWDSRAVLRWIESRIAENKA